MVTDQYEYEAFGSLLWQTGGTANPYRFTGERYDADLDLYYLRTRWYNQATGRFLTRDTYPLNAQNPIEWNRYLYTANNPVNAVDPSGLNMLSLSMRTQKTLLPTISVSAKFGKNVALTFLFAVAVLTFAKGGNQNLRGDEARRLQEEATRLGKDICTYLKELRLAARAARDTAAARKFERLEKAFGCRHRGGT